MELGELKKQAEERELRETLRLTEGCIEHLEQLEDEIGMTPGPRSRRLKRSFEMASTEINKRLRGMRA